MKPTRQRTNAVVRLSLLLSVAASVGCGGKPASVTGLVTVDGKPVDQGTVTYSPSGGGMRASGLIQSDGTYEIKTNRDAGLEIGMYDVAVVSREVIVTSPDAPPMPGKYIVPKRYGKAKTSGLQFDVVKGGNDINLELTSEGLDQDNKPRRGRR